MPADLSALRIRREPEKARGMRGWLLLAAVLVVAAGVAAYFLAGRTLRGKTVETVAASIVTEGQATTLLSATGYVEAERKADLSPKITSRITQLNVTEGNPGQDRGRHRAARPHRPGRPARGRERRLGQREGGARPAEGAPGRGPRAAVHRGRRGRPGGLDARARSSTPGRSSTTRRSGPRSPASSRPSARSSARRSRPSARLRRAAARAARS